MTKFILAFTALSLVATPALAGERSVTVSHADLDLKSAAGRAELGRRLAVATEQVCGSYAGASNVEVTDIGRCRNEARRRVAAQLGGSTAMARR